MSSHPRELSRRLAAFWFADIVGFTSLSARDERAALAAVELLRQHAAEQVEGAGGRVVKISGDAVLAEFPSSDAAIASAIQLRDALAHERTPVHVHIGVHLGEVSLASGDIYGDGVNTAARLQSHAAAGQILTSEDIYRRVRANPVFRFAPIGALALKGLPEPVRAYIVERADPSGEAGTALPSPARISGTAVAHPLQAAGTRLIVLPFRMLRPDAEIEFLAFSLADAISFSLSKLQAIVVRSLSAAARFAGSAADPREVARHTDVDLVVAGTLLRVTSRIQITAELNDGRDGTLLGSYRGQADMGDLFELQEEMTSKIVSALALPLTTRERQLMHRDVPATARAYELYLRANGIAYQETNWETARDLYQASLREDPTYAPASARLGRCYRLIAKYGLAGTRENNFALAEAAFQRAIELNPDLDLAHGYAATLETELGRCGDAMIRLLDRLESSPRGVELLAGLVHSLRYCGLLDESLAADRAARAIDASARTSIAYTHFMRGDFAAVSMSGGVSDLYIHALALMVLGRDDEASALLREASRGSISPVMWQYIRPLQMLLAGETDAGAEAGLPLYRTFPDPEGRLHFARHLAWIGRSEDALELIEGLAGQYGALPPPGLDPWLASLDRTGRYAAVLDRAAARRDTFRQRFLAHPASHEI